MAGTDKAAELYAFVKEYAQLKLEAETKRYESLIQQASNMQAAFSFSTAALFMVAAIVIEYRGKLSLTYFLWMFASAQSRGQIKDFADVGEFRKFVEDHYTAYFSQAQRDKAIAEQIEKVQLSASQKNDEMACKIRWSMRFFYIALGLSACWFVISVWILYH